MKKHVAITLTVLSVALITVTATTTNAKNNVNNNRVAGISEVLSKNIDVTSDGVLASENNVFTSIFTYLGDDNNSTYLGLLAPKRSDIINTIYNYTDDVPYIASGVTNSLSSLIDTSMLVSINDNEVPLSGNAQDSDEEDEDFEPSDQEGYRLIQYKEPKTKYVKVSKVNLRSTLSKKRDDNIVGHKKFREKILIYGELEYTEWYYSYDENYNMIYISRECLSKNKPPKKVKKKTINTTRRSTYNASWSGEKLNRHNGTVHGPSGKETYYNLNMSGIIRIMRSMGNNDPYWVRADGCKMLGNYIMVAADLRIRPRGSLVQTSLGTGIVCDTGTFIYGNSMQLDLATTW